MDQYEPSSRGRFSGPNTSGTHLLSKRVCIGRLGLSVRNVGVREYCHGDSAAERIRRHLQIELAPEQFIVIGDTPNDIDCARHFGARVVAVGTGRSYSSEEMLACNPDAWLADLSDPELVVNTLDAL